MTLASLQPCSSSGLIEGSLEDHEGAVVPLHEHTALEQTYVRLACTHVRPCPPRASTFCDPVMDGIGRPAGAFKAQRWAQHRAAPFRTVLVDCRRGAQKVSTKSAARPPLM
jgi:hypothetical protein